MPFTTLPFDVWPTAIACLTVGGRAADISCYRVVAAFAANFYTEIAEKVIVVNKGMVYFILFQKIQKEIF